MDINPILVDDYDNHSLTVQECWALWRARKDKRWWITAYDFMAIGMSRWEAYARFALLSQKATTSVRGWGKTSTEGRRNTLCFHFEDEEWQAIEELLMRTKYHQEVEDYGRSTAANPRRNDTPAASG